VVADPAVVGRGGRGAARRARRGAGPVRARASRFEATGRWSAHAAGAGAALLAVAVFGVACSDVAALAANAPVETPIGAPRPLQLLSGAALGAVLVRCAARRVAC
jgi:hypothetical protein